jgi:hypothetical protein
MESNGTSIYTKTMSRKQANTIVIKQCKLHDMRVPTANHSIGCGRFLKTRADLSIELKKKKAVGH